MLYAAYVNVRMEQTTVHPKKEGKADTDLPTATNQYPSRFFEFSLALLKTLLVKEKNGELALWAVD